MAHETVLIGDYFDLIAALVARRKALGISQEGLDHEAGLQHHYVSKLERPASPQGRNIGPATLGPLLNALGLKLVAVPDEAILTGVSIIKIDEGNARLTGVSPILAEQELQKDWRRRGGIKAALKMSPEKRIARGRKAIKARWRAVRAASVAAGGSSQKAGK